MNIKFYTRSFNIELWLKSSALLREADLPIVRLTDLAADDYFYAILADEECDVAINVDEDCFVTDLGAVLRLAESVYTQGYANAGCPDCGKGCPRTMNPIVTNPFFNIFNLKLIRTRFSRQAVDAFNYEDCKTVMQARFPLDVVDGVYDFDDADREPYYRFFLWLAYQFPTLYLHGKRHADGITTMLYDPEGVLLCEHTWFARFYTMPSFIVKKVQKDRNRQKERIDNVITEVYGMRGLDIPKVSAMTIVADRTVRWAHKIPQRVARRLKRMIN